MIVNFIPNLSIFFHIFDYLDCFVVIDFHWIYTQWQTVSTSKTTYLQQPESEFNHCVTPVPICINLVVNVVIWQGEMCQFENNNFFNKLSTFCQNLLRTMKIHLEVMIRNNGIIECNELLLAYFKFDYQRIDGYLFGYVFDYPMSDSHPHTLNGILTNWWVS